MTDEEKNAFYENYIDESCFRRKVFGGWVVTEYFFDDKFENGKLKLNGITSCFVPDPKHEWIIGEE